MGILPEQFLSKDGQLGLDLLHGEFQSRKSGLSMGGGYKDEQADLPCLHPTETVVAMHAHNIEFGKGGLFDLLEFLVGHGLIGRIFNGGHRLSIDRIGTYLPQKDLMGPDLELGAVLGNGIRNEFRGDAPLDEY